MRAVGLALVTLCFGCSFLPPPQDIVLDRLTVRDADGNQVRITGQGIEITDASGNRTLLLMPARVWAQDDDMGAKVDVGVNQAPAGRRSAGIGVQWGSILAGLIADERRGVGSVVAHDDATQASAYIGAGGRFGAYSKLEEHRIGSFIKVHDTAIRRWLSMPFSDMLSPPDWESFWDAVPTSQPTSQP